MVRHLLYADDTLILFKAEKLHVLESQTCNLLSLIKTNYEHVKKHHIAS